MVQYFQPKPRSARLPGCVVAIALTGLVAVTYAGCFNAPFVFDDFTIVNENPFMRSLWPPSRAMEAPYRSTAAGRPLVAYSFAVNYAVSGLAVWSYHLFNLTVHAANVLLLYALLRRTAALPGVAARLGGVLSGPVAGRCWAGLLAAAWAVHPLNSETVVYIAQRTELMMAFFVMAAFACLLRSARHDRADGAEGDPGSSGLVWPLGAVVCGVLAALCKETAAVLPVLLLLFDRAFVAGSFKQAWRRRKLLHLGGIAVIAVAGVLGLGGHRGGLEVGDPSVTWRYLLTQGAVILHYLRLSLVPYPLAITHEWPLVDGLRDGWLPAAAVGLGLLATGLALVKRPMIGFLGSAFYLLLAPTSSVIPIMSEVVGERRMYLPLIAVLILIWAAAAAAITRWSPRGRGPVYIGGGAGFTLAAIMAWSAVTVARVQDYQTEERLWRQTLRVQPGSLYARSNLAGAIMHGSGLDEAERLLKEIQLESPDFPHVDSQLALVAFRRQQFARASDLYLKSAHSIYGKPTDYAYAGYSLIMQGKREAGAYALGRALEMDPDDPTTLNFVATVLSKDGKYGDAVVYLKKILANYPEMSAVWSNLAHNLTQLGRPDQARAAFRSAFEQDPDDVRLLRNFGNFEAKAENHGPAIALFRRWLHLEPHAAEPRLKLVTLLVETGDDAAAAAEFARLVVLHPRNVEARQRYAWWLLNTGRSSDAARQMQVARELDPDNRLTLELGVAIEEAHTRDAADALEAAAAANGSGSGSSSEIGPPTPPDAAPADPVGAPAAR